MSSSRPFQNKCIKWLKFSFYKYHNLQVRCRAPQHAETRTATRSEMRNCVQQRQLNVEPLFATCQIEYAFIWLAMVVLYIYNTWPN